MVLDAIIRRMKRYPVETLIADFLTDVVRARGESTTLSPKRLELLRQVHRHPEKTVSGLATILSRDYKRVHDDVSALSRAGLTERDEDGLRAPCDSVRAAVPLEG